MSHLYLNKTGKKRNICVWRLEGGSGKAVPSFETVVKNIARN